jgi:DNA-binding transcriptional LysR family regulator
VPRLNDNYPRLNLDIREQVSLVNFEKNQADLMISLSPISRADVDCVEIGTLHLIPIASRDYLKKSGVPQRQFISQHVYVQCNYYASEREIWDGWRGLVEAGHQTHNCENSLAYFALVRNGAGVGLLGNYVLADPELVPLELGVHVALPVYLTSVANRRQSRPVAAVYDWIVDIFRTNPSFESRLTFPSGRHEQEESLRKMLETIAPPPPSQFG